MKTYLAKRDWDFLSWYRSISSRKKISLILLGSIGIFCLLVFVGERPLPKQPEERSWLVSTQEVLYKNVQPNLEKFGVATATHRLFLKVLVPGEVLTVESLLDGAFVDAGERILSLDPAPYEFTEVEAKNRLLQAKQNLGEAQRIAQREKKILLLKEKQLHLHRILYQRLESLSKTDTISTSNLDDAHLRFLQAQEAFIMEEQRLEQQNTRVLNQESIVSSAQASYERAQRDLKNTILLAPFDGVISTVNPIAKGQSLSQQEQIGILYDPSSYEVRVTLTPSEYGRLASSSQKLVGQKVSLFQSMGQATNLYQGVVARVGAVTSKETASIPIYIRIEIYDENNPLPIKEESFMRVFIPDVFYHHVIELPITALYGNTVYTVNKDSRLEKHQIRVVQNLGNTVLITGDLLNGQRVLINYFSAAANGVKVRPNP